MTILECARLGKATLLLKKIAAAEKIDTNKLLKLIREGRIVVPLNAGRVNIKKPCAIGFGLRTKVNANIGTSTDKSSLAGELKKLKAAVDSGADAVMDLSVGAGIKTVRREILKKSPLPVGTVPVYEIAVEAQRKKKDFLDFSPTDVLEVLEGQAREGVDFFTIHSGVTKESLAELKKNKRVLGIVSRGGAILAAWVSRHKKENPFFEYFDDILDICHKYDVTLSLGDGLRPGSIWDATDKGQVAELKILGKLASRAKAKGVQAMIEGPGHVPLNEIQENIALQKKFCHGAPFYVLGPLVTDVAAGYDHITSAIGGALAASSGADFLCYVTPSEHLRHPSADDVKEGVIASRIAAHAADIVKNIPGAKEWDRQMSIARKRRDWKKQIKLSIDPVKAGYYRRQSKPNISNVCTMCGRYCSIKVMEDCLRG